LAAVLVAIVVVAVVGVEGKRTRTMRLGGGEGAVVSQLLQ
jgi:hypothetical protein